MFGGSGVIHQASTNCGIRRSSIGEHGEGLENMENLETWKTSTRWVKTLYLSLKTLVNQMAQNTLFLRNLSRHLKIITNTLLVNMILGQLKIGVHQAKCRSGHHNEEVEVVQVQPITLSWSSWPGEASSGGFSKRFCSFLGPCLQSQFVAKYFINNNTLHHLKSFCNILNSSFRGPCLQALLLLRYHINPKSQLCNGESSGFCILFRKWN